MRGTSALTLSFFIIVLPCLALEPDPTLRTERISIPHTLSVVLIQEKILPLKKVRDTTYDCRDIFESSGVIFPEGSSLILDTTTDMLHIVNTASNIDLIRTLVSESLEKDLIAEREEAKYTSVSLYSLIVIREKYDGRHISTAGYLMQTHTGYLLLTKRDDAMNVIIENGLALGGGPLLTTDMANSFVRLKGVFHAYPESSKSVTRGYIEVTELKKSIPDRSMEK